MRHLKICNWGKFQHYKKRNPPWIKLYASILDDDDFDCLPDDSKLLYLCLLPFASRRENKVRADLRWLQKKLPIQKTISNKVLQPLIDAGFIDCYQDDSKMIASCKQNATPETETETEKRQSRVEQKGFEKFWNAYPKKVGKGGARKAWDKIKVSNDLLDTILTAVGQQKNSKDWKKDEGQFIPHPATWLNQERWTDVVAGPVRKAVPKNDCPCCGKPGKVLYGKTWFCSLEGYLKATKK